jgi:hypothetical protein
MDRLEGVLSAIEMYINANNETNILINALYHKFKNYSQRSHINKLFVVKHYYNDRLEYYNSIHAYYVDDKESGYDCCKNILIRNCLEYDLIKITLSNILFYEDLLLKDNDTLELFYAVDNLISKICGVNNENVKENYILVWNILLEKNRSIFTIYNKDKIQSLLPPPLPPSLPSPSTPIVFLSCTTCKRLSLYKQTINSILTNCLDIHKVDYWFCVDDNSNESDRQEMRELYPFINYYMKTPLDSGHRKSMNIIWDKLNQLRPTYWLHIEDDFLFHTKMNYITEAVVALSSEYCIIENIKQILFNRNYAETIHDYQISGHISNDSSNHIVLHNHCIGTFNYRNCNYWPHFSFRPSFIETATILDLGNLNFLNNGLLSRKKQIDDIIEI